MNRYELNFIIPSPGDSVTLAEFSPNGQFLAVGDQDLTSLYILDKLTGFHPKVSAITLGQPTALVWETDETFYVGLNDGYFIHYRINFKRDILVEGAMNGYLRREGFPITSMALDAGSTTLVVSVGPAVFAFRRIRATSRFLLSINHDGKLMQLEANSDSSPISQLTSASGRIREPPRFHFQDPFHLPQTMCSSSHSADNISCKAHNVPVKIQLHSHC